MPAHAGDMYLSVAGRTDRALADGARRQALAVPFLAVYASPSQLHASFMLAGIAGILLPFVF